MWYEPHAISKFCKYLCRNQYPTDCAKRDFLILSSEVVAGLGASLHLQAVAFAVAMHFNRTFVYSPDLRSHWTYPDQPTDACGLHRSLACYWVRALFHPALVELTLIKAAVDQLPVAFGLADTRCGTGQSQGDPTGHAVAKRCHGSFGGRLHVGDAS